MKLLIFAFYFLPWAGCVGLLLYGGLLRKEIRRRVRENAEATAAVLRKYVIVDGVQLPRPEDERWATGRTEIQLTRNGVPNGKTEAPCLHLGPATITGDSRISSGENGVYVNGSVLEDSPKMVAYAASVWATQRSRAVREALEKGETS